MPYIRRDIDRAKSSAAADEASGSWNSKSSNWGDDAYMKALDKETIKRQQEKMRQTADDEMQRESGKSIPSYKKGGTVKKTGLALLHKGEHVVPAGKVKSMKGKCVPESQETPEMEAKSHPKGFLKQAAYMSSRKLGHGKNAAKDKAKGSAKMKKG
jgi:hypothetical protein